MLCEPCEYLRDNGALSRFFGVKRDNGSSDLSSENTVDLVEVEVINDFIVVVVLGFFFDPKGNTGISHSVVEELLLVASVVMGLLFGRSVVVTSSLTELTSVLSLLGITPNFGMVSFQASG